MFPASVLMASPLATLGSAFRFQRSNARQKATAILVCFIILFSSCKELYKPKIDSPETGYLVVEGYINSSRGPTVIKLSRTKKLSDGPSVINENGAMVSLEGDNNENYLLREGITGTYTSDTLTLNSNAKYRIKITASNGHEYASEYVAVKYTPPIDSISWRIENDGVQSYINTHDPNNNTKYYRWQYDETWEIHSPYQQVLRYIVDSVTEELTGVEYIDPLYHSYDSTIYRCWQSFNSSNIILGTSEKLSSDRIFLPLIFIEHASVKISVLYSMNLKQYALSEGAFKFYQQLKKNTEQLGSIFDAQPSELPTNIICTSNPEEVVIGFIDATQEQTKRIYIDNKDLSGWNYRHGCTVTVIANQKDSIMLRGYTVTPVQPHEISMMGDIVSFDASVPFCVDCKIRGTNVKPWFWPR